VVRAQLSVVEVRAVRRGHPPGSTSAVPCSDAIRAPSALSVATTTVPTCVPDQQSRDPLGRTRHWYAAVALHGAGVDYREIEAAVEAIVPATGYRRIYPRRRRLAWVKEGQACGAGCAAGTVVERGSEPLIFVAPRAGDRGLSGFNVRGMIKNIGTQGKG
jgi:hypothetical protein